MKYIFTLITLIYACGICAQNLLVEYELRRNFLTINSGISGDHNDEIENILQQAYDKATVFILKTTPSESIYALTEQDDILQDEVVISFFEDELVTYKNRVSNIYKVEVGRGGLINKDYLIVDTLGYFDWKIEEEYQSILNIQCQKATAKYYDTNIIAWFTESIPINDGPFDYHGLPGLILKVEEGDKQTYIASSIEFTDKPLEIVFNTTGEEIGRVAFRNYIKSFSK